MHKLYTRYVMCIFWSVHLHFLQKANWKIGLNSFSCDPPWHRYYFLVLFCLCDYVIIASAVHLPVTVTPATFTHSKTWSKSHKKSTSIHNFNDSCWDLCSIATESSILISMSCLFARQTPLIKITTSVHVSPSYCDIWLWWSLWQ